MDDRDFIEVEVEDLYQWMRRVVLSEKVRTPCHWLNYSGSEMGRKWVFRGQSDATWDVASTLERSNVFKRCVDTKCRVEIERYCFDEFLRRSNFPSQGKNLTAFDWVALMQHNGCPTRLIDFSYSAFVALYFAVSDISHKPENNEEDNGAFAVWAISLDDLRGSRERFAGDGGISTHYEDANNASTCEFGIYDNTAKELFDREGFGLKRSRIYLGFPKFGNERSNAQSGVFLFQSDFEQSFMKDLTECLTLPPVKMKLDDLCPEDPFRNMCSDRLSRVVKFIFPNTLRQDARLALRSMNMFPHTIFPDLGGIAQTISQSVNEMN